LVGIAYRFVMPSELHPCGIISNGSHTGDGLMMMTLNLNT